MNKEGERNRRFDDTNSQSLDEWLIERPVRLAVFIATIYGVFLLTMKCDSDRRETECLPLTSCHQRLWKESHPGGEEYPYKPRPVLPPGFTL